MRHILLSLMMILPIGAFGATERGPFTSCGPGYILATHSRIDGITAYECQKLWCRDLETGKPMGSGTRAASGYRDTSGTMTLCDAENRCIECFGDRNWCSNMPGGVWNPEYGAYTRGGGDSTTYVSYQKGGCFAWHLGKPNCPNGETALERNGEWVCVTAVSPGGKPTGTGSHSSSIRRTGTLRRL